MAEKSKKPAIRFAGFTEAWEQRKLIDIASMHARIGWQNLRTSEFLDSGDYLLITGTDFDDGAINYSTCHYVSKYRYEQDRNIQIRNGSILITKDGTLGKVAYTQGLSIPATLNAGVFNIEIKNGKNVDSKYLFHFLKAPFLMDYVDKKATGGTIKHLNQNILIDFPVAMPNMDEQRKIGLYLHSFDNLITLHQRKYDKLVNVKKAMLEKMFPKDVADVPEIRFKGFTEAWEQRKLGEVGKARSGVGFPDKEQGGSSGTPFFKVSDMNNASNENEMNVANNYVTDVQIASHRWSPIDELPAIFFAKVGAAVMLNRKRLCRVPFLLDNNTMSYSLGKNLWDADFAKALFETVDLTSLVQVGALPSYNARDVEAMEIMLPKIPEQKQIGQYFQHLDNLITLHQRKLEKLKNLKKACLEKMFV
ncbi:restriction endonuclease subunit S [Mogibacterium diversum]|uniref:restriction endonuclease subunit S n=1 Tax=Mogibacterium diversum TaxID=114527 RepID=UPI0028EB77B0|nr:restriction endonuclease subunit S [Mogibacterium diversum]